MRTAPIALAVFLSLTAATAMAADLDRTLRVQARLETSAGMPASGDFTVTLALFPVQSGGAAVYTQAPVSVTVAAGVFDADLGPIPAGVLEAASSLWLQTTVGPDTLPREPLRAVPFSLLSQAAKVADAALDLTCTGCVSDAEVGFSFAAAASKGGDATGLQCGGCVEASDLASGAIAATHLQDGAVTPAKVSFAYAAGASQGGAATGLACTGCVGSTALASGLALAGDTSVSGALSACTAGASGCGLKLGAMGLYDHKDAALTAQAASLRVRNSGNSAWAPLLAGAVTAGGDLAVIGQATVQGTLAAAAVGAGTQTPGATLEVAGNALMGGSSRYLSFGSVVGAGGYGIRDLGGRMQVKNEGGDWMDIYMPPPPAFGTGADGTLSVNGTFDINTNASNGRAKADGIAYAVSSLTGSTIIATQTVDGILAGDKVLLVLVQATGATGDVGSWDLLDVKSVSGAQVGVTTGTIDPTRYDDGSGKKLVMQRVPQYSGVVIGAGGTLTASAWDGLSTTGAAPSGNMRTGIVALLTNGTLTVGGGGIDVSQKGFAGGAPGGAGPQDATNTSISSGGQDGGNGGYFMSGGKGGGTGSGGAGGTAGYGGTAGGKAGSGGSSASDTCCHGNNSAGGGGAAPLASGGNPATGLKLTLGGGAAAGGGGGVGGWASPFSPSFSKVASAAGLGGSHGSSNAARGGDGSAGAQGGGMVVVYAKVIAGTGPIKADGGKGGSGGGGGGGIGYDGTAGGGGGAGADGAAGGSVVVKYELSVGSPAVGAQGGDGGGGGGGGGGDGGGGGGGGGGGVGGGGGGGGSRTGQTCCAVTSTSGGKGGNGGQAGNNGWAGEYGAGGGQVNGGGGSVGTTYNAPANGGGQTTWGGSSNGSPGSATVNGGGGGQGGFASAGHAGGGGGGQAGLKGKAGYADLSIYVPADLAEWMPSADARTTHPGDLLVIDGRGPEQLVRRSELAGDPTLIGVVSTYPALRMGEPHRPGRDVLVALAGRVPVKVTTDAGPILPGDPITASDMPGVGMLATLPGRIVGFALGSYDRPGVGLVTVLVSPQHWAGPSGDPLSAVLEALEEQRRRIEELEARCGQ